MPLLLFYLTVVAQSGEITVKCRSIASHFNDPLTVSLFVFFEIEVFAFFGIILGLWVWLTFKFIHNCLYHDGPQFSFKTKGIKMANDTLVRNYTDAFVFTGIFWDMSCNSYLLSSLNISSDIMTSSQKSMLKSMVILNLA